MPIRLESATQAGLGIGVWTWASSLAAKLLIVAGVLYGLSGCASLSGVGRFTDHPVAEPVAAQPQRATQAPQTASAAPTAAADPATSEGTKSDLQPNIDPSALAQGEPTQEFERGIASWYGPGLQGRRTANGERFDMHSLTAAHKTLPFGTRVRVRNVLTGKEVEVRVNDRGPFTRGRVIDLSRAAAEALGLLGLGVKHVLLLVPADTVLGHRSKWSTKAQSPSRTAATSDADLPSSSMR